MLKKFKRLGVGFVRSDLTQWRKRQPHGFLRNIKILNTAYVQGLNGIYSDALEVLDDKEF